MSEFSLAGKVVLVTGASAGLGEHFARVAAAAGAQVALAARRRDRIDAIARELKDAVAVAMDVTDAASVEAGFAAAAKVLGPITILVNNAGVAAAGPAVATSEKSWDQVIDTNLKGALLCSQVFARRLIESKQAGAIINIASLLGLRVASGLSSYAVSKAGLIQLTQALALEFARHNIRVNALAPGYVETDMSREFLKSEAGVAMVKRIPQRRALIPDDLTGPFLLLASEASRAMTGAVIPVDGGHQLSGA